ncbi:MAG: hypothetical protein WBX25_35305 [Rhodomicrobium sp.]
MRLLTVFLEIVGVMLALCLWALITDILWDDDHRLLAMAAFVLIPAGFFNLALGYDEWRKSWPNRRRQL